MGVSRILTYLRQERKKPRTTIMDSAGNEGINTSSIVGRSTFERWHQHWWTLKHRVCTSSLRFLTSRCFLFKFFWHQSLSSFCCWKCLFFHMWLIWSACPCVANRITSSTKVWASLHWTPVAIDMAAALWAWRHCVYKLNLCISRPSLLKQDWWRFKGMLMTSGIKECT